MRELPSSRHAAGQQKPSGYSFLSSLVLVLAWLYFGLTIILIALNRLRQLLGYESFDSQWGILGIFSLYGIIVDLVLALVLSVLCPIAYVVARVQRNRPEAIRALKSLALAVTGFVVFLLF